MRTTCSAVSFCTGSVTVERSCDSFRLDAGGGGSGVICESAAARPLMRKSIAKVNILLLHTVRGRIRCMPVAYYTGGLAIAAMRRCIGRRQAGDQTGREIPGCSHAPRATCAARDDDTMMGTACQRALVDSVHFGPVVCTFVSSRVPDCMR